MNITNKQTKVEKNILNTTLKLYRESVKNVPILRYSWIIIGTICILSLTAYFKLKNTDVFLYALVVLFISFLGFVFSFLTKTSDIIIRVALYILVYAIIMTMATAVCSFGYFIVKGEPTFYKRYFPDQSKQNFDSIHKIIQYTIIDSVKVNPLIQGDEKEKKKKDENVTNDFTLSEKYSPKKIFAMTSSQIQDLTLNIDISEYQKHWLNKWNYNDLAKLIFILKDGIPVFQDSTIYYKSEHSNKKIPWKDWTFENIKSDPKTALLLWKDYMHLEHLMILNRLVSIKENPSLYDDKINNR